MRTHLAAALAAASLAASPAALARDLPAHLRPLAGLRQVYVIVHNPSREAKKIDLKAEAVQRVVELKLKMAGIGILTPEESLRAVGAPFLSVNIGMRTRDGIRFGDIAIAVHDQACLRRDGDACGGFITWQTSGVFTTKSKKPAQWLQEKVCDSMDLFLQDYLAANPREKPIPTVPDRGQ